MAFILEKISPADYEKYQLTDINPFTRRKVSWDQWLIDRERNIYLRVLGAWSRDDPYNIQFHLFWRGALLAISFESKIENITPRDVKVTWAFGGGDALPVHLRPHLHELYSDLKEALTLFKSSGTSSPFDSYVVEFAF